MLRLLLATMFDDLLEPGGEFAGGRHLCPRGKFLAGNLGQRADLPRRDAEYQPAVAQFEDDDTLARSDGDAVPAGMYVYLPLGWRSLRKLEQIIREELDRIGCQELMMPALNPAELWEKTGRHLAMGQIVFKIIDRRERKLFLGPTHEEVTTELARHQVRSYRDLPQLLYQLPWLPWQLPHWLHQPFPLPQSPPQLPQQPHSVLCQLL